MPDLVTHQYFGQQVLSTLPESVRSLIREDIFYHTTPGPDVWFTLGFYGGRRKALSHRGGHMHEQDTGAFLSALARETRSAEDKEGMFSYLCGFLCHYSLDTVAHPYIYCRTGDYDGTEATRCFRGAHTRLERAIDCYVIRRFYGDTPTHFSITDRLLTLRCLPDTLRTPLNEAYKEVYGWENTFDDLNAAISDQRFFYRLMRDPLGLVNGLTRLANDGKSHLDYRLLSYKGRDLKEADFDYLNDRHTPWHNPWDVTLTSEASFFDLLELARQKALQLIDIIYNYVYHNEDTDLPALIGNATYSTGMDCDDPRNEAPGRFEPLF